MDVFDDNSDDADDFRAISEANFRQMQSKLTKIGYADGAVAGEESGRQAGFNAGFADGLRTAFELAKYESLFKLLKESPTTSNCDGKLNALRNEQTKYENLNLPTAESPRHCKYLEHKELVADDPAVISEQQKKYVDDLNAMFKEKLPLASEFLQK